MRLLEVAKGLPRDRFFPMVWCSERDGPVGEALRASGVPVYQRPLDLSEAEAPGLAEWLKELAPAIFHSFSYRRNPFDVAAAYLAGIPVVITSRNSMPSAQREPWEQVRDDLTTVIVANSYAAAEASPHPKVRVIQNGVPIPRIREHPGSQSGTIAIGSAGNLRPVKGYDVLLEAVRLLRDRTASFHVSVFGADYGQLAALGQLRAELGVEKHITFRGQCGDMSTVYPGLDVYVQSSYSEGLPTAILEALSYGIPVVTTAAGGCAEAVIDGETGLVTAPGDASGLASAMERLIASAPLRARLGAAGRQRAIERFNIDRVIREYTELYLAVS